MEFYSKSQIALEYAYRMRARIVGLSVIWVYASNSARFVESYKRIATECNIPGKDDPDLDVLQLVRDWLEISYERKFLMIIDNVDDRSIFFDKATSTSKALREYTPQCDRGTIIYTTRSRDIGINLSLDREPIFVPSMEVEEARSLLGERIRSQSTNEEQLDLLEELVFLPLAICQATAFMLKRNRRIFDYLKMYKKGEETRIKLLGQRFNYHGREARPLESVITTWWISFNSIKMENSRAADLLSIMSYMDYQAIPFSLLIGDVEDRFDFEEAMGLLEAFSLVTLDMDTYYCQVHQLATVATQAWLAQLEEESHKSALEALYIIYERFPDGRGFFQDWSTCSTYLPHAESVLRHTLNQTTKNVSYQKASLSLKVSNYLEMQGQFEDSERLSEYSMRIFEELHGRDHEETLDAIFCYACTLTRQGRYRESLAVHREVLAGREKVIGHDHGDTLASLGAVGINLRELGCYREAAEIHRKELAGKEKLLRNDEGSDSTIERNYLNALGNVARVTASQGRYAEAEKLHHEVLERSKALLGSEHPDIFIDRGLLIDTIWNQGRLAEAEGMVIALPRDRTDILGEKHYDTLKTIGTLAAIKARQGKLEESESLTRKALGLSIETLGENHPSTINDMHDLACIAFERASYAAAESTFRKCLIPQINTLGPTHPHTLLTRRNIGNAIREQGRWEEAEKMDYQSIELCESLAETREMEMEIAPFLRNIGDALEIGDRYLEAEPVRRQELDLRIAAREEKSPQIFNCLDFLGNALSEQDKFEEAIPYYERAVEYNSSNLGREDQMIKGTIWHLAVAYRDTDRFELAEKTYRKLRNLQEEISEPLDSILFDLSWVLSKQEKYAESEENYREVLMLSRELPPEKRTLLHRAIVMNNLASVMKHQDVLSEEAENLLREAYDIRFENLGAEDPLTIKSLMFLAEDMQYRGRDASVAFEKLRALGVPAVDDEEQEDGHCADSEHDNYSTEDEEESSPAKSEDEAQGQSQEHRT